MLGIWCASANAMVYGTEEVARLQAEQAASEFTGLFFGITTTIVLLMIVFGIYRKRMWYVIYSIGLLLFGIVIIINNSTHWVVFYEAHGVGVQDGAAIAPLYTLLCLHIAAIIIGWGVFFLQTWCKKYTEDIERKALDSLRPARGQADTETQGQ